MSEMSPISTWLGRTTSGLGAAAPGLPRLAHWASQIPFDLVDLVALEVELDAERRLTPPSLHVRVRPERVATLRDGSLSWLGSTAAVALPRIATVIDGRSDGGERGFVCEDAAGNYELSAIYANVPGGFDKRHRHASEVMAAFGIPPRTIELIERLPAHLAPRYVGAMVGRPGVPARLVFDATHETEHWDALRAMAPALMVPLEAAQATASSWSGLPETFINVDVLDGEAGPRVGLELKPPRAHESLAQRSAALVPLLEQRGVAGEIISELTGWEGREPMSSTGGAASGDDVARLLRGERMPGTLRRLNHVKLTFDSAGAATTKAYLFAYRIMLSLDDPFDDAEDLVSR